MNIQKIVAFENTFERLFAIIQSEGLLDGGVVVEDCLRLMWQLLEGNVPNQILFRENNFIQRLLPLFEPKMMGDATDYQSHWSVQKVVNLQLALHVVRALLSARKQNQETRLCQTSMYKCGLLSALCAIVMAVGVPADVLNKAIYVLADVIRGCPVNQEYLAQVIAPSEPPQPVITILVISMVTERQELAVRAAALYCFQCYVTSNRETQSAVIQTLLPKSAGSSEPISMGQLLFGGLFSDEVLSVWFSAIALSHCILDNPQLKEELLRFQMALAPDGSSIRLLQHCLLCFEKCGVIPLTQTNPNFSFLPYIPFQSNRFQARIGMLQFLCSWLAYCPEAIHCFLSGPSENDSNSSVTAINAASADPKSGTKSVRGSNWSMLLAEAATLGDEEEDILVRGLITLLACICIIYNPGDVVGFDRATLKNTLERRIGLDTIVEYLSQVSKAESFTMASKHPELKCHCNSDLVFDYSFTLLFKRLEYEAIHLFQPLEFGPTSREPDTYRTSSRVTESQIAAYEEKLAIKDAELNSLRNRLALLETEMSAVQNRSHLVPNHSTSQPQPPVFYILLVTLCFVIVFSSFTAPGSEHSFSPFTSQSKPNEVDEKVKLLEEKLNQSVREKEELKSMHDDLLLLLHDQDVKLTRLKRMVRNLGGSLEDISDDEHSAEATTQVAQIPYTGCDHPSVQTTSAANFGPASFNIPRTTMQLTHPSSSTPTPATHLAPSKQGQQTSHFIPNTAFPQQTYYSANEICERPQEEFSIKKDDPCLCDRRNLVHNMSRDRRRRLIVFFTICVVLIGELILPLLNTLELPINRAENGEIRVLLVSDPHVKVYETRWDIMALASAYDSDCYLQRYFNKVVKLFSPDAVIISGDLLDGGSTASSTAFTNAAERVKNIFLSHDDIPYLLVPGDNDVGGAWDDPWSEEKSELFHETFQQFTRPKHIGFVGLYGVWSFPVLFYLWKTVSSKDNLTIYVAHNPVITPYGATLSKELVKLKPALLISGHDHVAYALHWEKRTNTSERIFWLVPPDASGQPTKPFQFDLNMSFLTSSAQGNVVQLGVPSCTYRSGQAHLAAYGALQIWRNRTIRYHVVSLPNRQNILIFYLVAFCCIVFIGLFSLSLRMFCAQIFLYVTLFLCAYFIVTLLA
ncbi:hypothetical protein T265_01535 [Opisthorchis viverrini]|uniref:Calcineurin-like phosphoesterase domain-containing protein n=1 Tax=Opisthorchis viverrini TaxID=6198 RepID=A0A074ZYZ9_OPIVI|nr:hypothetical protein T265_01535 [Opisthorchis viverrini]KER32306.1 hypothetical protein T265_01535 [Opisthorchis viverrini]